MKKICKSFLALSIAISGLSFAGPVLADTKRGSHVSPIQKVAYRGDRNRGGKNWNRGRGGKKWNRGRGRNRGHGVGNVVLGVGLGYLMFGGNKHRHYRDRHNYRDSHYYDRRHYDRTPCYVEVEREVIYRDGPSYRETVQNAQNQSQDFGGANCLQIREYQTIITIGGEEKEAYGDACLQADGSWIQGAPKVVPNFN